ncbi:S1/P1 nuclease [Tropicimonas sp. TH_r6]|uniref:S1/P1 nuclease n=1 Tax=Tropicimonas sp. TH_r6 TaxID=3082085 RepID=UPI002954024A|nr:S1/P1 nuclease [Tropicimonas sp. TH_r6]MDV7145801.1 S1/P1 nuclease [Tropicimonas sp. TH_r6]
MLKSMMSIVAGATAFGVGPAMAWDHPSHMITAAIAFEEIERMRPDLMERIGLMLMRHPDPAPFWVAASGAKTSKERARRMFIEGARWPDDSKGTNNDRLSWHSARFPIIADDASQETKDFVASRDGDPVGDALEVLELQVAVMANPEAGADERSLALSWFLHVLGDIHQPMHVTDYFSAEYPTGNGAGALSYVWDPMQESATTMHILWDSNSLRSTALEDIDRHAADFVEAYPRESFPQLASDGSQPDFRSWALEAHQIAIDFVYGEGLEFVKDPDSDMDAEKLVGKMVNYVLFGISPLEEAPEVPAEYWESMQDHAHSQITLAGYRIADVIVAAADKLLVEKTLTGQILESMDNVQSRATQ